MSKIELLSGDVDGINTTFQTASRFVSGTVRVIINGQVYESDDEFNGWSEVDPDIIEFTSPPVVGDIVQAFYQDKDSEHLGIENVVGSPFDPNGVIP